MLLLSSISLDEPLRKYAIDLVGDRSGVGRGMNNHVYFGIGHCANV